MNIKFGPGNSFRSGFLSTKRKHFGAGSLAILVVAGLVFLGVSAAFYGDVNIDKNWERIEGSVVSNTSSTAGDGTVTYVPTVSYVVKGTPYMITSKVGSSSEKSVGSSAQVAYNPSQPEDAKIVLGSGSKALLAVTSAVGVGLLVAGPVAYIRSRRRGSAINNLMQTGHKVQGILSDLQTPSGTNKTPEYRIVVSAPGLDGATREYVSDSMQGIGGLAMADFRTSPIPIDVYLDPTNPDNYYVDIADVPALSPERINQLIQSSVPTIAPQAPVINTPQPIAPVVAPQTQPVVPPVQQPAPEAPTNAQPPAPTAPAPAQPFQRKIF